MNESISREYVRQAYLELLGREPESEDTIAAYRALPHRDDVRRVIVSSEEYALRQAHGHGPAAPTAMPEGAGQAGLVQGMSGGGAGRTALMARACSRRMAFVGSRQAVMLARLVNAMSMSVQAVACEHGHALGQRMASDPSFWAMLDAYDVIWFQRDPAFEACLQTQKPEFLKKCRVLARIECNAFHPDCVTVTHDGLPLLGPTGAYHSALVLWGFLNQLSADQVKQLFHVPVFRVLGYLDQYAQIQSELVALDEAQGSNLATYHAKWRARGVWMHAPDRPKAFVLADVARHCLAQFNEHHVPGAEECVQDLLAEGPAWPVYPPIAAHLGLEGAYAFKLDHDQAGAERPVQYLSLHEFVAASYDLYARLDPARLRCEALESVRFQSFQAWFRSGKYGQRNFAIEDLAGAPKERPLLLEGSIWRKSVSVDRPSAVDPVSEARFIIQANDVVGAFGGCFSQLLRHMRNGWCGPTVAAASAQKHANAQPGTGQEGVMVQSARQLLQLFQMAFGIRQPGQACWVGPDGGILDPLSFSPKLTQHADEASMLVARQRTLVHFAESVRRCSVLVITLGQTQVCRRRHDGLVVNYAPDYLAHDLHQGIYEHVNPRLADVLDDMEQVLKGIKAINPGVRVLLAVSSTPLVATYDDQSVLSANHCNKSMLRVVCDELRRQHGWIDYFPSYEILTGTFHKGKYLADDLRTVTPAGLAHLWQLFSRHYLAAESEPTALGLRS